MKARTNSYQIWEKRKKIKKTIIDAIEEKKTKFDRKKGNILKIDKYYINE